MNTEEMSAAPKHIFWQIANGDEKKLQQLLEKTNNSLAFVKLNSQPDLLI